MQLCNAVANTRAQATICLSGPKVLKRCLSEHKVFPQMHEFVELEA